MIGQADIIKIILETAPESVELLQANDQYDNTPLHLAADQGQAHVVQLLLEDGR